MFPHLEDEHFKVVPLQQVAVVRLQLLHLDRLFVHALPHVLQVPADFAGALQQLADAVGGADVGLGQAGHVPLHDPHGALQVGLPLLHALLVLLHRLQHVDQLVQQRHHGDGAHLAAVDRAARRDRGRAGWTFQAQPGEGAGLTRGGRCGRRAEARDEELRVFGLLLRDGVGAAGAGAELGVGRAFFHGSQVVKCPASKGKFT